MQKLTIPKEAIDNQVDKLTVEQLKNAVPKKNRNSITPQLVNKLNDIIEDPTIRETFRENVIGFSSVLSEPNVKLESYINAVKYVSYKMTGCSNQEAYSKTFPDRLERMQKEGRSPDVIRAAVSAYAKGKIVVALLEQSMVPTWIMNADIYQQAVNEQARLMLNAKSEKVRSDAANSLLHHLKAPEVAKVDLNVAVKEDESVIAMREALTDLVKEKRKSIEAGVFTAGEIAKSKLIEGEVIKK